MALVRHNWCAVSRTIEKCQSTHTHAGFQMATQPSMALLRPNRFRVTSRLSLSPLLREQHSPTADETRNDPRHSEQSSRFRRRVRREHWGGKFQEASSTARLSNLQWSGPHLTMRMRCGTTHHCASVLVQELARTWFGNLEHFDCAPQRSAHSRLNSALA